jgi:hypothetical protein
MADTSTAPTRGGTPSFIAPFPQGTTQITQSARITSPVTPPDIIYRTTFSSETVKRLTKSDFALDSKDLITLNQDDCVLVLFYAENTESIQLVNIWAVAAQQIAGPVFAAINILNERPVAEAFMKLKGMGSHSLHWASLKQFPFILVYRNGYPAAFYNGSREVQSIIDYALTLACEAGYYEHTQIPGSMQAETRIDMDQAGAYNQLDPGSQPIRKTSVEYISANPIRRFVPTTSLSQVGSTQELNESNETEGENEQQNPELPSVAEIPATGESAAGESAAGESAAGESAAGESAAGESTPAESAAAESTPAESAVGESTPAESAVGKSTPAESATAESTPAESAAAESTPAESAVGESTPAESTPAESAAAESTPAETTTEV